MVKFFSFRIYGYFNEVKKEWFKKDKVIAGKYYKKSDMTEIEIDETFMGDMSELTNIHPPELYDGDVVEFKDNAWEFVSCSDEQAEILRAQKIEVFRA